MGWGAPQAPAWAQGPVGSAYEPHPAFPSPPGSNPQLPASQGGPPFAPQAASSFAGPMQHAQGGMPYPVPHPAATHYAPGQAPGKRPFTARPALLLVVIGVCLAIFVTGVVLFVTTNF